MASELLETVERIESALTRFDDLGLERVLAGRRGPGLMISDIKLLLDAIKTPPPGTHP